MSLSKYHTEYGVEDSFAEYHQDKAEVDCPHTKIALPTLESFYDLERDEALQQIDGYGLDPLDQHFENYRAKGFYAMPEKLKDLEYVVREKLKKKPKEIVYQSELFDEIESNPSFYEDEVEWMEKQQLRCENGTFIFIKGKPTFITGIHYEYLLHWDVVNRHRNDMLPFYRDVDRRIFLFLQWAYTTKSAYFKYQAIYRDFDGEVRTKYFNTKSGASDWAAESGIDYMLVDWDGNVEMEYRTCYGVVFPKRRRIGGTSQCAFFLLKITMRKRRGIFAIQALTETSATDDVYGKKVFPAYKKMWFFLRPEASRYDTNGLSFMPDRGGLVGRDVEYHGGSVIPRSSENKSFDGNEVAAYLRDEPGKVKNSNVNEDWSDTMKDTLAYGENIHGFAAFVSTLGKIDEGGREFFQLCRTSMAHDRNDLGQTQTGLFTLFISAPDGYDGCIDIYGESIINDPKAPYMNLEGKMQTKGSKRILEDKRKFLMRKKNVGLLNAEMRNNPFTLREAAKKHSLGQVWDAGLSDHLNDIRFKPPVTRRYTLAWSDGLTIRGGRPFRAGLEVLMIEDAHGRFEISLEPAPVVRNRVVWDPMQESWSPTTEVMDRFVLGIDPYKFNEDDVVSNVKTLSKGGGVMKYKRDPMVDGDDIHFTQWQSNRYVLDYLDRPPTTEEFSEDMLMAAVLFGAMGSVERNVSTVIDDWKKWKFGAYLMYFYNIQTGKVNPVPGIYTSATIHQTGFSLIRTHISMHHKREVHVRILEQVEAVESFEDVTHNDLFSAMEMCEIGCANTIPEELKANAKNHINPRGLFQLCD